MNTQFLTGLVVVFIAGYSHASALHVGSQLQENGTQLTGVDCPFFSDCLGCSSTKTICCSYIFPDPVCCGGINRNDNCNNPRPYYKAAETLGEDNYPKTGRVVATLRKVNDPSNEDLVTLTISHTDQQGLFLARLSGAERGEKYMVVFGQDPQPLIATLLENEVDSRVALLAPSLEQLGKQPVVVLATRAESRPVVYAEGSFTFVDDNLITYK